MTGGETNLLLGGEPWQEDLHCLSFKASLSQGRDSERAVWGVGGATELGIWINRDGGRGRQGEQAVHAFSLFSSPSLSSSHNPILSQFMEKVWEEVLEDLPGKTRRGQE